MELVYVSDKVKTQCTSVKAAKKLFGGDTVLATSLLARINALEKAETIKDIIVQPTFHFHNLGNKHGRDLDGFFAIDVKSRRNGVLFFNRLMKIKIHLIHAILIRYHYMLK